MKKYILYCITILILLSGCGLETSSVSSNSDSHSGGNSDDAPYRAEDISLNGHKAGAFAYNPVVNSLALFEKKQNTYTACMLQADNTWTAPVSRWVVGNNQILDNFTYGSSGLLYACRKYYDKKGRLRRQTFVELTRNGKLKPVPLKGLNQTPKSTPDTITHKSAAKNRHTENYSVQDIRFCGTALALTYANHTVKFYNIAEGQALGCADITGEPDRNSFYDYHYISAVPDSSTRKFLIKNYDIRSGELTHTITLSTEKNTTAPYFLTNYRERLYLLSADGLFCGSNTENSLTKPESSSISDITSGKKIKYFEAARDDVLYIAYETQEATLHLSRFSARQ